MADERTQRPPILPPAVNEEVIAPKIKMQLVKETARKRLKKYHSKFTKLVKKFLKKSGCAEIYLQFYDIGYRYEAVFQEVTMDGTDFLGTPLPAELAEPLLEFINKNLKLPTDPEHRIVIESERDEQSHLQVIKLIAQPEYAEIQRLSAQVEHAPRSGNPGL